MKIRVLFVSSGASGGVISSLVKNQGESIRAKGVDIGYFLINSGGFKGYINNMFLLKGFLRKNEFDLVHAHYSFCGIIASFATRKPLVVSLMGSDVMKNWIWLRIISILYRFSWKATIVKASWIKDKLNLPEAIVIPNGLNLSRFKPIDKINSCRNVGFDLFRKHIVFIGNPSSKAKNIKLIYAAYNLVKNENTELHIICNTDHELIPQILNSADVLVLSSFWEGSPNVIKEALACNIPIVTTPVGDVKELLEGVDGCYISSFDPVEFANYINQALKFGKRTNGRKNVLELDEERIADKIIEVYRKVLIDKP